jgi:hypothetical protein
VGDNSLPILRSRHKLDAAEWKFLQAYAQDPSQDLPACERAAGLAPGRGRALLQSARGRGAMGALLRTADERYEELKDQLIQLVASMASWDPKDCFDAAGNLKKPADLPNDLRVAITEFKFYPASGAIEYKFANRLQAVELLLRVLQERAPNTAEGEEGRAQWVVRGRQPLAKDTQEG